MLKFARFLHFATLSVEPGWEQQFDRLYNSDKVPSWTSLAERIDIQRYHAVRGTPNQLLLEELTASQGLTNATWFDGAVPQWAKYFGPRVAAEHALYTQIFPDEGLLEGIEWGSGNTRVGGLRVTRVDAKPEHDADVSAWYHEEHIPLLCRCPGAIGGRRFRAIEGAPMYMTIIYLTAPQVLEHPAWRQVSMTPWSERLREAFTARWSAVYEAL
jgi:hypothetical protein